MPPSSAQGVLLPVQSSSCKSCRANEAMTHGCTVVNGFTPFGPQCSNGCLEFTDTDFFGTNFSSYCPIQSLTPLRRSCHKSPKGCLMRVTRAFARSRRPPWEKVLFPTSSISSFMRSRRLNVVALDRTTSYAWSMATALRVAQPNQRLKLSARGGRVIKNWSILSAAAAGRSLSAFR